MGLLLSMVFRKRWLTLIGLGVLVAGILSGPMFHNRMLTVGMFCAGIIMMVAQIPFAIRHDLGMIRGSDTQKKL